MENMYVDLDFFLVMVLPCINRRQKRRIKIPVLRGSEDILGKLQVGDMRYDLIESVVNSGLGGKSNSGRDIRISPTVLFPLGSTDQNINNQ